MKTMGVSLFVLILVVAGGGAVVAQDGREYVPITPENADQVTQVAILEREGAIDVSWSPDGKRLLVSSIEGGIWLYDVTDLRAEPRLIGDETQWMSDALFSPDGSLIASNGWIDTINRIQLWDVETGELLRVFGHHSEGTRSMDFSPDGTLIADTGYYRYVHLWDVATGELVTEVDSELFSYWPPYIWSLDYSPDGTMVAFTSELRDKYTRERFDTIAIWDAQARPSHVTERLVFEKDARFGQIMFSPDSRRLAVGEGRSVRLIDVATGETIRRFGSESGEGLWNIAFSPDGSILATGGTDRTIWLWEVMTGEVLTSLDGHTDRVAWIGFNMDGTLLASVGLDDTIRLWGIPAQE